MNSQDLEAYVPVYDVVPETWPEGRQFLVEQLKKMSNAINIRQIGWFLDQDLISGKQWIPGTLLSGTPDQYRTVFRKVVDTGQLPNSSSKDVPHGLDFGSNFTLVNIYGAATEPPPGSTAIPLPFVDVTVSNNIQLYIDSVNVKIITSSNQSKYTRSYVVIEYLQEL